MLASFVWKRTYNKLTVTVRVDCERKESVATVTYDGVIRQNATTLDYETTRTPDLVNRHFTRPAVTGRYASVLEALEANYRSNTP